ncbi:tryptophan-rich sensory protein [Candidatus Gottesmanbacteria bacterium]|nr:tryptophan-rich sensory protein [Candidatus Gottesmanbacteria bacterium]
MKRIKKLLVFNTILGVAGLVSSGVFLPEIYGWYSTLQKPLFAPPRWFFGSAWTIFFLLMVVSVYLVWEKGIKNKKIKDALVYFSIQLILEFIWRFLFFDRHELLFSSVEIILLWFAVLLTIIKFWKVSKTAAYLLIPYILWVSYIAFLNYSIFKLNP